MEITLEHSVAARMQLSPFMAVFRFVFATATRQWIYFYSRLFDTKSLSASRATCLPWVYICMFLCMHVCYCVWHNCFSSPSWEMNYCRVNILPWCVFLYYFCSSHLSKIWYVKRPRTSRILSFWCSSHTPCAFVCPMPFFNGPYFSFQNPLYKWKGQSKL